MANDIIMIREYEFRQLPGRDEWRGDGKRKREKVRASYHVLVRAIRRHPSCAHCPVLTLLRLNLFSSTLRTGRKVFAPRVSSADRAGGTYLTGAMNTNLPCMNFFFLPIITLTDTERQSPSWLAQM